MPHRHVLPPVSHVGHWLPGISYCVPFNVPFLDKFTCETDLSSWYTSSCGVPKSLSLVHYSSSQVAFFFFSSLHGFPRLFTVISEHICFLLFSFSVFTLFSCRFDAVD